ncbi:hypothetical protein Tsubulata_033113 [Turnera subulata]|uniref:Ricin B lectin domain-containing protein n=1 Tax=Turnera subulata TaxID=218843 RepID=A0A9Q0J5X2_9ROSI|nr:hypothetical protein Tsubulata_033113 [Turnera subulata]
MISECVRSDYILNRVVENFVDGFLPDKFMTELENSWGKLSTAVRNSDIFGNLKKENGKELVISLPPISPYQTELVIKHISLIMIYGLVSLLKRDSSRKGLSQYFPHDDHWVGIIEPVTNTTQLPILQQPDHLIEEENTATRIAGPNDNNPNQLWTFKKDGTIRSNNNFCLNPYGGCPAANYITIYECPEDPSDTFARWEYREDRTIAHYMTGLVLTARSGKEGALGTLTVDVDKHVPGQGWVANDYTTTTLVGPVLARIEWLPGRCLNMMSDNKVVLGECGEGSGVANKWNIYWHRSIQNGVNKWGCLGCKGPNGRHTAHCGSGSDIVVQGCCVGLPSQPWEITGDGRIENPETGLFVTVVSSGDRVIAAPRVHEGGLNQSWIFKLNG